MNGDDEYKIYIGGYISVEIEECLEERWDQLLYEEG